MTAQPTPADITAAHTAALIEQGERIYAARLMGQGTPADATAERAWRVCGHRADYASAAEHQQECPGTLAEHGVTAQPDDPRR